MKYRVGGIRMATSRSTRAVTPTRRVGGEFVRPIILPGQLRHAAS